MEETASAETDPPKPEEVEKGNPVPSAGPVADNDTGKKSDKNETKAT
jgi:hypothetical protein